MNKTVLLATFAAALLASCGTGTTAPDTSASTATAVPAVAEKAVHTINTEASAVNWTGTMLGVKSHTGILRFTKGELATTGGSLSGGSFTVDMKNYTMTDDQYAPDGSEQGTRAKLMGHLMSADFFDAENFPTAEFVITKVEGNTAEGNLTIRGVTHPEKVTDIVLTQEGGQVNATGKLSFDRQKYGVRYSTGMKDMVIADEIALQVDLKGQSPLATTGVGKAETTQVD